VPILRGDQAINFLIVPRVDVGWLGIGRPSGEKNDDADRATHDIASPIHRGAR
jgi:hypothetical protein